MSCKQITESVSSPLKEVDEAVHSASKLAYESPVLIHYGDVRDITLGPTVGIGESGNELGRRNPP